MSAANEIVAIESSLPQLPLRQRLQPFLSANPEANLVEMERGGRVTTPWGDDTLYLRIFDDSNAAIDALNAVRMPPIFTALWHSDSRDLEFIFMVAPQSLSDRFAAKSFVFRFEGVEYRCDWAESSARLTAIAQTSNPSGPPTTGYRNLESYAMYARLGSAEALDEVASGLGVCPISFWLRAVDLDEVSLADLAHHINFYMRYFDSRASQLILNEPPTAAANFTRVDLPHGAWPSEISARRLDSNLLTVWRGAAVSADPFMAFLLYYQVLEYAGAYFLDEKTRKGVDRILRAPDVTTRASESARRIIDVVSSACAAKDDKRLDDLLVELVDPELIWRLIEPNKSVFARPRHFAGGVVVEPLVGDDTTPETFCARWPGKLGKSLRHLRNALAHPGAPGGLGTIQSCEANKPCLEPWLMVSRTAASQVVLNFPA